MVVVVALAKVVNGSGNCSVRDIGRCSGSGSRRRRRTRSATAVGAIAFVAIVVVRGILAVTAMRLNNHHKFKDDSTTMCYHYRDSTDSVDLE